MELNINGQTKTLDVPADMPILWALRDELGMTGTKYGCGLSLCGACTVWLNGAPIRACVTPVSAAVGGKLTTIENSNVKEIAVVQDAWSKLSVPQCGYCQSGQIMAAAALLQKNKKPSDSDIDAAMNGNICRCGTYNEIRDAIKSAASKLG